MDISPSFIYLASASPRRQALLREAGVRFELLLADAHEDAEALEHIRRGESPTAYVERVAIAKANAGWARMLRRGLATAPVLGADTTVAVGGTILAKPTDAADAIRMLQRLSGRSHRVLTAVAVARGPSRIEQCITVSRVSFARLSRPAIEAYVATGEPLDKAGAYAIQGGAAAFVRRIEGSYTGIVGLPLYETLRLLRRAGRSEAR
jgi:septum formation protein